MSAVNVSSILSIWLIPYFYVARRGDQGGDAKHHQTTTAPSHLVPGGDATASSAWCWRRCHPLPPSILFFISSLLPPFLLSLSLSLDPDPDLLSTASWLMVRVGMTDSSCLAEGQRLWGLWWWRQASPHVAEVGWFVWGWQRHLLMLEVSLWMERGGLWSCQPEGVCGSKVDNAWSANHWMARRVLAWLEGWVLSIAD